MHPKSKGAAKVSALNNYCLSHYLKFNPRTMTFAIFIHEGTFLEVWKAILRTKKG